MKYYKEPKREIPIVNEVDVLVVGGGPAGFSSAYNAAKQGAKTMLIEQSGSIGGVATTGLMSHWTGNTEKGFYDELLERSRDDLDRNGNSKVPSEYDELEYISSRQIINPEKLKRVMIDMLDEVGAEFLLYTFASDVIMDGDKIIGVITESKSGRQAILGKIVIDASGDGDIAAKAGEEYYIGRESDSRMQPMTLMFKVGGVDTSRVQYVLGFEQSYEIEAGDLQTIARQKLPFPAGHVLIYPTTLPGIVTCNMTNCVNVDGTKAEDLTQAEKTCRNQIPFIVEFLQEYVPGFENCFVISSASIIGVRETRHFIGEYIVTEQDIEQAKVFDDWIAAKLHFNFDIHNLDGAGLDQDGVQKNFKQEKGYTIPYRACLPKKIENLLLCGRNISGTHKAHSNYRVMPICVNVGQGVGIAAALSVRLGCTLRELDIKQVQKILNENGVEV